MSVYPFVFSLDFHSVKDKDSRVEVQSEKEQTGCDSAVLLCSTNTLHLGHVQSLVPGSPCDILGSAGCCDFLSLRSG